LETDRRDLKPNSLCREISKYWNYQSGTAGLKNPKKSQLIAWYFCILKWWRKKLWNCPKIRKSNPKFRMALGELYSKNLFENDAKRYQRNEYCFG
jgi:hypothetical protein